MEARKLKRVFIGLLAVTGVLLSLSALFLLSVTAQNSDHFDRLHNVLIGVNIGGAILLLVLVIGNLIRLLRDYRENVPGARLKARMVGMFVGLAVLPLIVVFYFAVQYINRGIDSWFDVEIDESVAIDTVIDLQRTIEVPINTTLPIDETFDTRITVDGPFGIDIPLNITVPIQVDVPIDLVVAIPVDETIPISTEVPVQVSVPIAVDVAGTELAQLAASLETGLLSFKDVIAGLGG